MHDSIVHLSDDLVQVRLPLPFALKIVNCYLVRDDDKWCIFDTGLHTPQAENVWRAAFKQLDIRRGNISRIVLTHSHPDHYGMAGYLQRHFTDSRADKPPPVLVSEQEFRAAQTVFQHGVDLKPVMQQFLGQCGLPAQASESILGNLADIRMATQPHPTRVEFLQPGQTLHVGQFRFEIIHTPGHADGHLVFYDPAHRLILSGDHVLMFITPNISQWPLSEANPLGRYLHSLRQLQQLEVDLALPGHKKMITNWRGRIVELVAHHEERLSHMKNAINGGATAFDVCTRVFDTDALSSHEMRFALTETLAHLEYLVKKEALQKSDREVWRYSLP